MEDRITLREFNHLKKQVKAIKWQITSNLIEILRAQKTKQELAAIESGSRIIDRVFQKVRGVMGGRGRRGMREGELAYLI